jgi:hypothetical protein
MTTRFLNNIEAGIGNAPVAVLSTVEAESYTVIGLNLANTTSNMVQVSVKLAKYVPNIDGTSSSVVDSQGYIMKNVMVAPQSSLKVITNSEKLILSGNNSIIIFSNVANSIDAIVSYVAIA